MFNANAQRYSKMIYRNVGKSGLKLPILSLGLWHNFGDVDNYENSKKIVLEAFNNGIIHFDLANNYGPPFGSAEINFGRIIQECLLPYRDEIIISTKAGYPMWDGPLGSGGSRKHIIASCDQSLRRMQLEYVDIFYHHRPDEETLFIETALALDYLVKSGRALYIGISNYTPQQTAQISKIFEELNTPFIIHQAKYSMFERKIEDGLWPVLEENGLGNIIFSPLAQGLLSNRYLDGIPEDSRANRDTSRFLDIDKVHHNIEKVKLLNEIACKRQQTLAQMAIDRKSVV